jgi:hypothetical protein
LDRCLTLVCNWRTSPSTTPIRRRACRTSPRHWAASGPRRGCRCRNLSKPGMFG